MNICGENVVGRRNCKDKDPEARVWLGCWGDHDKAGEDRAQCTWWWGREGAVVAEGRKIGSDYYGISRALRT